MALGCSQSRTGRGRSAKVALPTAPLAFVDSGEDLGTGAGKAVILGDVDGDGDQDAIVCMGELSSLLLLNDGRAKFSRSGQDFPPSSGAGLGDLDGDGDLDAFFTEGKINQVWLNDGRGGFAKMGQELTSPDGAAVALGDLDGDGDLDAFVANWSGEPDQVFRNDGKAGFSDSKQRLGAASGTSVALGDVDGDGDLDVLVSNNGEEEGNSTELWLNKGKGKFALGKESLGPSNAYAVVLGDLDGDGDLDAFIANSSHAGANPPDKVWINDGKGGFTDSGQSLGELYSMCAALADFDGDGDLDAFTGSWKSAPRFWMNDGKGRFTDSELRLASPNVSGAAAKDLDGDGAPDLLVAANTWAGGDGQTRLWLNRPIGKK
jgi:hypothetical protein